MIIRGVNMIIRNRIQCTHCNDIIESFYTHHFVQCSCGAVFTDGGKSYLRRGFRDSPNDFIDLSEVIEDDK
jgi:hypothetical protein